MISSKHLRTLALSLPEVDERETWGHPTFRVRDKIFFTLSSDEKDAGVKATLEEQAELITMYSEAFEVADYTGRFGWVSVKLSEVNPNLMRELLISAWRRTAPKRLVAAYDAKK